VTYTARPAPLKEAPVHLRRAMGGLGRSGAFTKVAGLTLLLVAGGALVYFLGVRRRA
jgi:hypothetical protein